jgi:membrane associated rhomboid family serine protease
MMGGQLRSLVHGRSVTDVSFPRRDRWWQVLLLAVAASAVAVSVWGWQVGLDATLDVLGAPPSRWWYWPVVPLGWLLHLDAAHLVGNCVLWMLAVRWARGMALELQSVVWAAVLGAIAGSLAWSAVGDERVVVGLSGALVALLALVAVAGGGRQRWWAALVLAVFLLPTSSSSWWSHVAGAVVGASVASVVCARRAVGRQGPGGVHTNDARPPGTVWTDRPADLSSSGTVPGEVILDAGDE